MTNPELMILEEATEGLAPLIVAEIWRVIAQIDGTGISTLVVDRTYHAVLSHTESSAVLEKGVVVAHGKPADLLAAPEVLVRYLGV